MIFRKKMRIELNNNELRIILNSLNYLRNELIKENTPTDVVDELIYKNIKVIKK